MFPASAISWSTDSPVYLGFLFSAGLVIAIAALLYQHRLRRRLTRQAADLARSESLLADAQKFARLGHFERRLNQDPALIWSDETYHIFERDPAKGPPAPDELIDLASPSDRLLWRTAIERAIEHGEPYELDLEIEPAAGLKKTIHVRSRIVIDAEGNRTGWFGIVQDVTATRAAARAMRDSEQLLRALYTNLPLGLGVLERVPAMHSEHRWRVISLNPESVRQFNLKGTAHFGQALTDIGLDPDDLAYWTSLFDRCIDSGQLWKTELRCTRHHRSYAVTVAPLNGAGPHGCRCLFISEDVTDQRRTEAEVAQGRRLRAVGELVGGIAHQFNNLLTPVLLNADMLRREWAHVPRLHTELGVIANAAERSADLTRRLLAFGRKSESQLQPIELHALVSANLELVRHTIDRQVQIVQNVPADLPTLFLNVGDLHQIILNLLLNARDTLADKIAANRDHTFRARISITAEILSRDVAVPIDPDLADRALGWVRLTVHDNGLGMPPAVTERLFEPFFTTKDVGQGTGLGLATSWQLLADLGGRIDVASTPGEGTAVHICLPITATPRPETVQTRVMPRQPARPDAPRKFLLIEDEESVAYVVMAFLQLEGHDVTHAADGTQGWHLLSTEPLAYDAVIMDLNMPGMSGQEIARLARALPYERPIIIMSGNITEKDQNEFAALGINAALNKPFTHDILHNTLARVFAASERAMP